MKHSIILFLIMTLIAACSYVQPEQKIASEAADTIPAKTLIDRPITLNNEPNGSVSNLQPLATRIREIMDSRASNGVFRVGSAEIENDVFVLVEPQLSVGQAAEIFLSVNQNGGRALVRREEIDKARKSYFNKPNPMLLVVKTGDPIPNDEVLFLPYDADSLDYGFIPQIRLQTTPGELKAWRVLSSSIEIASDNSYFLNQKVQLEPGSGLDSVLVNQKPIADQDLKTVVADINDATTLPIIASERSSYGSLLKVFQSTAGMRLEIEVLVRRIKEKRTKRVRPALLR